DPCWTEKLQRRSAAAGKRTTDLNHARTGSQQTPELAFNDLLICEGCSGRFSVEHLRDHIGQILCDDCVTGLTVPTTSKIPKTATVPEHVQQIIATNPWLLLAVIVGIFWPIGTPLVLWV